MKTYTELEVIEILVANNNQIMKLIDTSKYFKIVGDRVITYRKNFFTRDSEINSKTFNEIITEAKGK